MSSEFSISSSLNETVTNNSFSTKSMCHFALNAPSSFPPQGFLSKIGNKENIENKIPIPENNGFDLPLKECNVWSPRKGKDPNITDCENEKNNFDESHVTSISCEICGNQFKSISELLTHHFICIKDKPYDYSDCDKPFSNDGTFKIHFCKHLCVDKNWNKTYSVMPSQTNANLNEKYNCFKSDKDVEVKTNSGFNDSVSGDGTILLTYEEKTVLEVNKIQDNTTEWAENDCDSKSERIETMHCTDSENSIDKPCVAASNSIHVKKLTGKSVLNSHSHTDINDLYSCEECGKEFSCSDHLSQHLGLPWKKSYFQKCFSSSSKENILVGQIYTKALLSKPHVKQLSCDICDKSFKLRKNLLAHLLIHLSIKPLECTECNQQFVCYDALQQHLRAHSSDKHSVTLKKKLYTCKFCSSSFKFYSRLNVHLRIHTNAREFKCDLCDKGFNQKSSLKTHMLTHNGKKAHTCSLCDKRFGMKNSLQRHLQRHAGDKPHHCNICSYSFTCLGELKKHYMKHTGELPYECDVCEKRFRCNSGLKAHVASHTGNLSHQCDVCQKKFFQKSALKVHKRIHTKDKTYVCEMCDKSYLTLHSLMEHRRVHTGEKPYVCYICNKAFSRKLVLDRHLLIHTGEKPFECTICNRFFSQSSSLQRHQVVHTKKKPYSCDICQKCFSQK